MTPEDQDWADDGIVALYIGTFAAREDLYVENGAGVVRAPLTPDVVRKAISHSYPVSAFLGAPDGRTHVGAVDFDTEDGFEQSVNLAEFLDEHNIPSLRCASRRGAHLWVTSWDWTQTGTMHRMLKAAIALTLGDEAAADPKIEVFPKHGSTELAVGALRLPGMPHQKDQQVYPIHVGNKALDPTFRGIIEAHQLTTPEAVERLAGKMPALSQYPKALGGFYGYSEPKDWGDDPSATEVLLSWGVDKAKPGASVLCPKHDDRRRSLTIFKDDKRVYCGAPHCALNNSGHGVGSVLLGRMAQ
jgi:hypothetical protein